MFREYCKKVILKERKQKQTEIFKKDAKEKSPQRAEPRKLTDERNVQQIAVNIKQRQSADLNSLFSQ